MKRRDFTQLLTLAAGSLGLDANDGRAADTPPAAPLPREPVNVEEFRAVAQAKLPRATYEYIATGSADEITLRDNVAAFQRLKILPPLLTGVDKANLTTVCLGQRLSMPILLAPVAAQRMYHPQGALASARAAAAAGTIFGVSTSVGHSVEEVAAADNGPKWFQLYVPRDRAVARRLVERVEKAGYQAMIVTVDLGEWKDADRRNRFGLPRDMLLKHLRDVGFDVNDRMTNEQIGAFNEQAWDLTFSWKLFEWLRSITKLPLLIKGVLRPEDARQAVSLGIEGIIVSNHGGRKLDCMPATIDMLPRVAEAVAGKAEIYMDGGVRRGTDVLKALALGARAVLIGRPYAWGLAADGEAGVRKVLELLREELVNAMITTGCARVDDVRRSLVM